jgi:hypothetical protein
MPDDCPPREEQWSIAGYDDSMRTESQTRRRSLILALIGSAIVSLTVAAVVSAVT